MNIDDLVLNPSDKLFYKKFTDVPFTEKSLGKRVEFSKMVNGKVCGSTTLKPDFYLKGVIIKKVVAMDFGSLLTLKVGCCRHRITKTIT